MAVSSVQAPGVSAKGPPPTMSTSRGRIAGGKLERGANAVAHRQTQEGPERPVPDALRRPGWVGRRARHTTRHVGFLCRCFNGTEPTGIAHPADRRVRAHAQLDK